MKLLILPLLALLFWAPTAQAAFSFQITSVSPATISDPNQEIQVNLDIIDLPSDSYFRVAFQKESGASYFGQIKNNSGSWVDIKSLSSPCQDYFSVPETASTSATILLRIGTEGREPGDYQIKAHRFTSTSCSSTESQNSTSISLNLPASTQAPTPTDSPPLVTNTPKPTSTPKPTATILPTAAVLGTTVEPSLVPTVTPTPVPTHNLQPTTYNFLPYIVIFLGVVSLGISGFLFLKERKSV